MNEPPPGAAPRPVGAVAEAGREGNAPVLSAAGEETERPMASSHEPYVRRQCPQCHGVGNSVPQAELHGPTSCRKCHADLFRPQPGDRVHGPAATGQCRFCHKAHESEEPFLLTGPQPGLCFRCHDPSLRDRPYHLHAGSLPCSVCHDPHLAGNPLLLADSRTYQRSKLLGQLPPVVHKPYADHQCDACHEAQAGNRIKGPIDALCLGCHKDLTPPGGRTLHAPVREGRCTLCHEPHESPLPNLIKPRGEELCLSCHNLDAIRRGGHPPMQRASCVLCHQGHSSPRGALLRPGIPSRRYPDAPWASEERSAPAARPDGGSSR